MKYLIVMFTLISAAVSAPSLAQDFSSPTDDSANQGAEQTLADQRFALFAKQAQELELTLLSGEQKLTLREQPLQTFSSDGHTFGSVMLWKTTAGRPAAIGTLGSLPINGRDFGFIELHWLLGEPIKPVTVGKNYPKLWNPSGEDVVMTQFDNGPTPAASASARLLQMRNLARTFTAEMTHGENRHQLRLLPQPLYRYEDNSSEKDGAIFAFVWTIGTDPEVLLHLQSRQDAGQLHWHWQPIRFTWRAVKLGHNGAQVWAVDEFKQRDQPLQSGPYLTTLTVPVE